MTNLKQIIVKNNFSFLHRTSTRITKPVIQLAGYHIKKKLHTAIFKIAERLLRVFASNYAVFTMTSGVKRFHVIMAILKKMIHKTNPVKPAPIYDSFSTSGGLLLYNRLFGYANHLSSMPLAWNPKAEVMEVSEQKPLSKFLWRFNIYFVIICLGLGSNSYVISNRRHVPATPFLFATVMGGLSLLVIGSVAILLTFQDNIVSVTKIGKIFVLKSGKVFKKIF